MEFDGLRRKPGQVWHQPDTYMPGWNADLLLAGAASRFSGPHAKSNAISEDKRHKRL